MLRAILLSTAILFSPCVYAEPFGTAAGYVQFKVDDGHASSEIGVGGSAQLTEWIDVRGIASAVTDGTDDNARINIALADVHTPDGMFGMRLGRVQHQFGFLNSQLNWAPARDTQLLPQGIYREDFTYMQRSGDGAQLYVHVPTEHVKFRAEVSLTKPIIYRQADIVKAWNGLVGSVDADDSTVAGLSFEIGIPAISTEFRYDRQQLMYKMAGGLLNNTGNNTDASLFGGRTELSSSVDVTYEYAIIKKHGSMWQAMNAPLAAAGYNELLKPSSAYGVTIGWQVHDAVKLTVGRSAFYNFPDDPHGKDISTITGKPAKTFYTEDTFIGAKYRRDAWIATIEYHRMSGTATMPVKAANTSGETTDRLIASLTWMF